MTSLSYSHQGQRDYQEDTFLVNDTFALVADGMGGHARGDIASQTVAKAVDEYIGEHPLSALTNPEMVQSWGEGLTGFALEALDSAARKDELLVGMGTTLLLAAVSPVGLVLVHVGDSRAYVVSPVGDLIHRTTDHSWVAEALAAGLITQEQAIDHPKSNVVTRALVVSNERRTMPEVTLLDNVPVGSRILLCSDGVLEAWTSDEALLSILGLKASLEEVLSKIQEHAEAQASDNNTAILAEYKPIEPDNSNDDTLRSAKAPEVNDIILAKDPVKELDQKDSKREAGFSSLSKYKKILRIGSLIVFLGAIIYSGYRMWLEWGDSISSILHGAD